MSYAANDPIRVAVIGFGLGGAVFHAPLVAATPGMHLASIVTSDPRRRARAEERYPQARILPDAEALWASASEHDLVVIATPNRFHAPLAISAFEAGLDVVLDKPMATGAAEGRQVVEEAERRGRYLTVFQNRRWDGDFLTLRRLLDEDVLGPVVRFESRFERWRPAVQQGAWRERADAEEAGGLLFDLGSHLIDQAVQLFGPVRAIYAEVDRRRPGAVVDDDAFVALTHGSGVRTHLWMSVLAAIRGPRLRVLGLAGTFEKHGLDVQEQALADGMRPGDDRWGLDPPELWGRVSTGDQERPIETEAGAYEAFYAAVARSLVEGAPPPVDPREAVGVLEIIEAAFESARRGAAIAMPDMR